MKSKKLKPGTMKTTWRGNEISNKKRWQMSLTNKKTTDMCWECGKGLTSWYILEELLSPHNQLSILGTRVKPVIHLYCAEIFINFDNLTRANAYKKLKEANKEIFILEAL